MFLLAHTSSFDHLETSDFYALHRNILQFISYYSYLGTGLQCHDNGDFLPRHDEDLREPLVQRQMLPAISTNKRGCSQQTISCYNCP